MLTLEQQYPSPDRCKKLAELGLPYDTNFYMRILDKQIVSIPRGKTYYRGNYYPCPSVPEMLEVMPKKVIKDNKEAIIYISWLEYEQMWEVGYSLSDDFAFMIRRNSPLACAIADCLIRLIENDLISFNK